MVNFASFRKLEVYSQKVLPDWSIIIGQKLVENAKIIHLVRFWKPETCGQTVLPDRSILIGQKLMENAKNESESWPVKQCYQTVQF